MAKSTEVTYEVKNELGNIGEDKKLRVISWNGKEAKIDLRAYWTDKDGNENPGKGVCLSNEEAKELVDLLNDYLNDEDEDF